MNNVNIDDMKTLTEEDMENVGPDPMGGKEIDKATPLLMGFSAGTGTARSGLNFAKVKI